MRPFFVPAAFCGGIFDAFIRHHRYDFVDLSTLNIQITALWTEGNS